MRQGDIDNLRTRRFQPLNALLPQLVDLGRHAVHSVFFRNANPHAFDAFGHIAAPVRGLYVQGCGILHVVATHCFQKDGAVFHGLGDWPGLIERRGKSHHAIATGAAIGRFNANRSRERSRLADGSARIRCRRCQAKVASDRRS